VEWPSLAEVVALLGQASPDLELPDEGVIETAKDWLESRTGLKPLAPFCGEREVAIRGRWGHLPLLLLRADTVKGEGGELLLPTTYSFSPLGPGPYSRILMKVPGFSRVTISGEWGAFDRVPAWARRAVLVKAVSLCLSAQAEKQTAVGGAWREGDVSESQNAQLIRQIGARFDREAEDLALLHRRVEVWAS
jgi:hypothetical protein